MNQEQNITKALSVCTKPAHRATPKPIADVQALQKLISGHGPAEAGDLIQELITTTPDNFDSELARVSQEYSKRQFLAHARTKGITMAVDREIIRATAEALPEIIDRLNPVFNQAVTTLTDAATELPPGPLALDAEQALAAEAGSALLQARTAIDTLATIQLTHRLRLRTDGTTPRGSEAVAIVTVPPTEVQLMHPFSQTSLNAPEILKANAAVRQLVKDSNTDRQLTILDAARGHYGDDITLSLAGSAEEVEERLARVSAAHKTKRVREHDTKA